MPRLLIDLQKQCLLEISTCLLDRYHSEGEDLLHHIVICDETWVHRYSLESKQASKEWRKYGEGVLVKAKTLLSAGKVLATVFWDFKGVLHIDFLQNC